MRVDVVFVLVEGTEGLRIAGNRIATNRTRRVVDQPPPGALHMKHVLPCTPQPFHVNGLDRMKTDRAKHLLHTVYRVHRKKNKTHLTA